MKRLYALLVILIVIYVGINVIPWGGSDSQPVENVTNEILDAVDVLVDGPFILEQKDLTLAFRGSRNQRLLTREDRKALVG